MTAFFIFSAKYLFVLPIVILAVYFFMRPRREWKLLAIFAVSSAALAYALAKLGGLVYYDPRPFVVGGFTPLIAHAADNGFPSDHALLVSAIAMIGTLWNGKLGAALWILAAIVAAARVYVGVHHVADVIGAAAMAVAATCVVYALMRRRV